MKKIIILFFVSFTIFSTSRVYGAQVDTEQLLKRIIPQPTAVKGAGEKKGIWDWDSYYEYSNVVQGSRPGRWTGSTATPTGWLTWSPTANWPC